MDDQTLSDGPARPAGFHPVVLSGGGAAASASSLTEVERLRDQLASARDKIANLELALTTARHIGIALGVVMSHHKITADTAFEVLRAASQRRRVKLRDLAEEVVLTGLLDEAGPSWSASPATSAPLGAAEDGRRDEA